MPLSRTEVCNIALSHLGQKPIVSPDENSQSARLLNLLYVQTRQSVLREGTWSFANRIEQLVEIANEHLPGLRHLYAYPPNCLLLNRVMGGMGTDLRDPLDPLGHFRYTATVEPEIVSEFRVAQTPISNQKCIAAWVRPAVAYYTADVENEDMFDSLFVDACTFKLASLLSPSISGDVAITSALGQTYSAILQDARRLSTGENMHRIRFTNSYINSR